MRRRLSAGAECGPEGVHFRVWAPRRRKVEVVFERGAALPLAAEGGGWFSGLAPDAGAGARYRYRLDGEGPFPDPASRFQPEGPHGWSQVIDPASFRWDDFQGVREQQVLYELHVGTFTQEGTYAAAAADLRRLAELGVTTLELMPVAEFPGEHGWGYDGVDLYAPYHRYGTPDDLRRFVQAAHREGLAVILDVVYNHLGPDGNYLTQFANEYFTDRYRNEWGEPVNFEDAPPARALFVENAGYWIDEFHFDGLRLDATQQMFDASEENVVASMVKRVREAARGRRTYVVAENESQDIHVLREHGCDAVWSDDFHHAAHVRATGMREAYYGDYRGGPQEFVSAAKYGWLYQGQRYEWQKKRRGSPARGVAPERFVTYLENHDQIANSLRGARMSELAQPGVHRALTALWLLGPGTPMIFQGQELGLRTPFLYFCDHDEQLAQKVRDGRGEFLAQFPSITRSLLPDPSARETFERCKLRRAEADPRLAALHADLLKLRAPAGDFDGAVLGADALCLRWAERLLLVNFGAQLDLVPAPEPLLAPPEGQRWRLRWSSEDPRYGGLGTPPIDDELGFRIPAHCAVLLEVSA